MWQGAPIISIFSTKKAILNEVVLFCKNLVSIHKLNSKFKMETD